MLNQKSTKVECSVSFRLQSSFSLTVDDQESGVVDFLPYFSQLLRLMLKHNMKIRICQHVPRTTEAVI